MDDEPDDDPERPADAEVPHDASVRPSRWKRWAAVAVGASGAAWLLLRGKRDDGDDPDYVEPERCRYCELPLSTCRGHDLDRIPSWRDDERRHPGPCPLCGENDSCVHRQVNPWW